MWSIDRAVNMYIGIGCVFAVHMPSPSDSMMEVLSESSLR